MRTISLDESFEINYHCFVHFLMCSFRSPSSFSLFSIPRRVCFVQHLHSRRIIHRDIKSLNVLLNSEGVLKICDLGASRLLTSGALLGSKVGTPLYIAPEVLMQHPYVLV